MIKTMISIMQMKENNKFFRDLTENTFEDNHYIKNLKDLEEFFNCNRGSMEVINNIRKYKVNKHWLEDDILIEYDFVIFTDTDDRILYYYLGSNIENQKDYVNTISTIIENSIIFSIQDYYNLQVGLIDTIKGTCILKMGTELSLV